MENRTPTWAEYEEVQRARSLLCYHYRIEQLRTDHCKKCAINQIVKGVFDSLPEEETVHLMIGTNPQVLAQMKKVFLTILFGLLTISKRSLTTIKAVSLDLMSDW